MQINFFTNVFTFLEEAQWYDVFTLSINFSRKFASTDNRDRLLTSQRSPLRLIVPLRMLLHFLVAFSFIVLREHLSDCHNTWRILEVLANNLRHRKFFHWRPDRTNNSGTCAALDLSWIFLCRWAGWISFKKLRPLISYIEKTKKNIIYTVVIFRSVSNRALNTQSPGFSGWKFHNAREVPYESNLLCKMH